MKYWKVGDRVSRKRFIGSADVQAFAAIVGDKNPIHSDTRAALLAGFERPIAHGMIAGSFFSDILGNDLPGPGSIYLEQTFKFLAPVYVGSEVELVVEVLSVRDDQKIIRVLTSCTSDMVLCLTGEAVLLRRSIENGGATP